MYFPSDKLYIETKLIKLGKKSIKKEFKELAIWARQELNVKILNASFSLINKKTLPSLGIVLELRKEYDQLHGDSGNPYNRKYNNMIASNFLRIMKESNMAGAEKYNAENFHMTYSVFSEVALIECLDKISKEDLIQIKEKYVSQGLWEISIHHGSITIFYKKEAEIEVNNKSGINKQIKKEVQKLVSKHDEFKYSETESYFFGFDSKEIFDKKYHGDWYSYYR